MKDKAIETGRTLRFCPRTLESVADLDKIIDELFEEERLVEFLIAFIKQFAV